MYIQRSTVEPLGAPDSSVGIVTRLRVRLLRNGDHVVGKDERILFLLQLSYWLLDLHSPYEIGTYRLYPGVKNMKPIGHHHPVPGL